MSELGEVASGSIVLHLITAVAASTPTLTLPHKGGGSRNTTASITQSTSTTRGQS
jgi:hypothetical protein